MSRFKNRAHVYEELGRYRAGITVNPEDRETLTEFGLRRRLPICRKDHSRRPCRYHERKTPFVSLMREEALVAFKEWNAMTDRILLKSGTVVSDAVRNRTREHENGGVPTFRVGDYAAKWRLVPRRLHPTRREQRRRSLAVRN